MHSYFASQPGKLTSLPEVKCGTVSCLVTGGKELAGARQQTANRAPPDKGLVLLCDLSWKVTHDSKTTRHTTSHKVTRDSNALIFFDNTQREFMHRSIPPEPIPPPPPG